MTAAIEVPVRELGPGGPEVPVLALGSWNTWDRMDREARGELLARAVESGAAFFDVAYYNMGPHAESSRTDLLFGETVRELGLGRERYVLCGKLWLWEYPGTGFREQMRVSLDRIGVEAFDAVVVGDFLGELDVARVVREVQAEVDAGSFRSWGVNNWPVDALRTALEVAEREGLTPPCFAQLKYGIARRSMAEGPFYGELFDAGTLRLQASDAFEGGILVGKTRPARKIGADVGGIRERILAAYPRVRAAAESLGATPAQLGLAFCLAHPAASSVLFGASSAVQLEENLGAVGLLERVGPAAVRAAVAGLQADDAVRADGVWDPAG